MEEIKKSRADRQKEQRSKRMAEALRENLRKRKQQMRLRSTPLVVQENSTEG